MRTKVEFDVRIIDGFTAENFPHITFTNKKQRYEEIGSVMLVGYVLEIILVETGTPCCCYQTSV